MCYHYSLTKKQEEVMKMIRAEWEMPFEPIYHVNGFDFPPMPVITMHNPDKVRAYNWGLIPYWVKTLADAEKIRAQTLNAKTETIFQKPAFRSYIEQNRCLIITDGFFEWMEFKKKKYPHYVHLKEGVMFAFAGLYAHWTDKETGELFKTFTVITTEANPLMARIHNVKKRMPVILPESNWSAWLDPALKKELIADMLAPCPDNEMNAYSISKLITTRGADTNVADIIKQHHYPELSSGEQFSLFDVER